MDLKKSWSKFLEKKDEERVFFSVLPILVFLWNSHESLVVDDHRWPDFIRSVLTLINGFRPFPKLQTTFDHADCRIQQMFSS